MLDKIVKEYIDRSVLCWLATVNNGEPSVSPKEIFTYHGDSKVIIANIASPQSVSNIQQTDRVCVSFVDVFSQKGFQLYGSAHTLTPASDLDKEKQKLLQKIAGSSFQVKSLIEVTIDKINSIVAPSYRYNKDVTEEEMIENALHLYGVVRNRST